MFSSEIKFKNFNLYLLLIYLSWIGILSLYFFFSEYIKFGDLENGVKFGADTKFYLREANKIISGEATVLDYKSKFGYILFLIPFVYFNLSLVYIVIIQLILTSISALCLYQITTRYFCKLAGIICFALFLIYFPIQIRNFYILTEMLFIDLVIILSFLFVFFKKKYLPLIIFLLFALISIRPNGILYLFSIFICIFLFFIKNKKYLNLVFYLIFFLILSIPIINLLDSYISDLNLIDSISNKGIIWGWSLETNQRCRISCLGVELDNSNYQNNLFDVLRFIIHNFTDFIKIFLSKVFWLLLRARPYYSDIHNIYILFFGFIIYSGFFYGFYKRPKKNFSVNLILFFILLSIILVGLTFADWSGRFSLYFLPLVMIFSSYGLLIYVKKISNLIYKK